MFLLFEIYELGGGWEGKGGWQTNWGFIFILPEYLKTKILIFMLGNMDPVLHLNSIAGNKVFSFNQTLLRERG